MSITAFKRALVPLVLMSTTIAMSACSNNHHSSSSRYGGGSYSSQSGGLYQNAGYSSGLSAYGGGGMYQFGGAYPQAMGFVGGNTMTYQAPAAANCVTFPSCGPSAMASPSPMITPPVSTRSVSSYTPQSTFTSTPSMPVECPPGTTLNPDGVSCMEQSSSTFMSSSTMSSSPTFTASSTFSEPSFMSSEPVQCPAGTTLNPDGMSCMEGSSFMSSSSTMSSSTFSSSPTFTPSSTFSSSSTFTGSTPVECPPGTTLNPDGVSCMEGSSFSSTSSYPAPSYSQSFMMPSRK